MICFKPDFEGYNMCRKDTLPNCSEPSVWHLQYLILFLLAFQLSCLWPLSYILIYSELIQTAVNRKKAAQMEKFVKKTNFFL